MIIAKKDLLGRLTLIFFYGLDFSYVCAGEMLALEKNRSEFAKRNTDVIAISVISFIPTPIGSIRRTLFIEYLPSTEWSELHKITLSLS